LRPGTPRNIQRELLEWSSFDDDLAEFGLVMLCFTMQPHLHKYDLHGAVIIKTSHIDSS